MNHLYLLLAGGLLFLTYPLALVPLGLLPIQYMISVPATLLLSLFSLPVLVAGLRGMRPWPAAAVAVFAFFVCLSLVQRGSHLTAHVLMLGHVTIPLAAAVALRDVTADGSVFRRLRGTLAVLWLVTVALGGWSAVFHLEVVGLSGNRNWAASVYLALLPWAWSWADVRLSRRVTDRRGRVLLCLVLTALPTLLLVHACASRGAWLALAAWGVLALWRWFRPLERWLFAAFLVLAAAVAFEYGSMRLVRAMEQDVRIPLWGRTTAMLADHDWFTGTVASVLGRASAPARTFGVGAGGYRRAFTPYRAASTYQRRLVAAPMTIHPHNEFLNIAAQIGLLAAMAWLALLLPLRGCLGDDEATTRLAAFSAFVIICHAMFDMCLVRPPGNLLALLAVGVCWRHWVAAPAAPTEVAASGRSPRWRSALAGLLALVAVVAGSSAAIRDLRVDIWRRRALIAEERTGDYTAAMAAYAAVAAARPHDERALLYAGVCALDRLGDARGALKYLERVYQLDPSYGHLNEKLGKAWGALGEHRRALFYFDRERRLYPALPRALQSYYTASVLAGALAHLEPVDACLRQLYADRLRLDLTDEGMVGLAGVWLRAVADDRPTDALVAAERLCRRLNPRFVDPLFFLVTSTERWPSPLVRLPFNTSDYNYWRDRLLAMHIADHALAGAKLSPAARAERLAAAIAPLEVQASAPYTSPDETWQAHRGSRLSIALLFLTTAEALGFEGGVIVQAETPMGCLLFDHDRFYAWRLGAPSAPPAVAATAATLLRPGEALRLAVLPQAYLLKNQILGCAIDAALSVPHPAMAAMPSTQLVRLLRRTRRLEDLHTADDLRHFVIADPIRRLYSVLSAAASTSPPTAAASAAPPAP